MKKARLAVLACMLAAAAVPAAQMLTRWFSRIRAPRLAGEERLACAGPAREAVHAADQLNGPSDRR